MFFNNVVSLLNSGVVFEPKNVNRTDYVEKKRN